LGSQRVDGLERSCCSGPLADELIEVHEQLLARDAAFRSLDERIEALRRDKEAMAREMSQRVGEEGTQIRDFSETNWNAGDEGPVSRRVLLEGPSTA
jgi:hypothetical protein